MHKLSKAKSLMIVDDYEYTRLGLRISIQNKGNFNVITEAENGANALQLIKTNKPDVVLMDIAMPKMDGISATKHIKTQYPDVQVIILSSRQEKNEILASIAAGADGYCLKDIQIDKLLKVIDLVTDKGIWLEPEIAQILSKTLASDLIEDDVDMQGKSSDLTSREKNILELLVEGKSNKEISNELGISLPTTKGHVRNLLQKLSVHDRTEAAVKAVTQNLI